MWIAPSSRAGFAGRKKHHSLLCPKLKSQSPEQILAISQVCDDVEAIDLDAFRQDMCDHNTEFFGYGDFDPHVVNGSYDNSQGDTQVDTDYTSGYADQGNYDDTQSQGYVQYDSQGTDNDWTQDPWQSSDYQYNYDDPVEEDYSSIYFDGDYGADESGNSSNQCRESDCVIKWRGINVPRLIVSDEESSEDEADSEIVDILQHDSSYRDLENPMAQSVNQLAINNPQALLSLSLIHI